MMLGFNLIARFAIWPSLRPCLIIIFDDRSSDIFVGLGQTDKMVPDSRAPVGMDLLTAIRHRIANANVISAALSFLSLLLRRDGVLNSISGFKKTTILYLPNNAFVFINKYMFAICHVLVLKPTE